MTALGELRGPLVRGGRGGVPAAALSARGGQLERGHDPLVRPVSCGSQVPRLTVQVGASLQGRGERRMGCAAFLPGRGLVHRRAHQRVPDADGAAVADEQPSLLGLRERTLVDAERPGGPAHHRDLPGVVRGRDQQQGLDLLGQTSGSGPGHRWTRSVRSAGRAVQVRAVELVVRQRLRELQQGQRGWPPLLVQQGRRRPRRGALGEPVGQHPDRAASAGSAVSSSSGRCSATNARASPFRAVNTSATRSACTGPGR